MELAARRQAGESSRGGTGAGAPGLGYRPGLDGLRALAVLAVLGYHTGVLRSGWIGVDAFFALSGYLITGLLLGELEATGTVRLRRFWARRFRRLLPGLVLLVGFVALLGVLRVPGWKAPHLDDVLGTVTYSSNWLRVLEKRSYWDLFRMPGPLEHVWSLAVEEQFYLVWPVVIWLIGRRHRNWIAPITLMAIVATSFDQVWLGLHGASVERLYVGTDTRAPAFLLGAYFVARFDRGGRPAVWATYTVPVGLAWLLAASVTVDGRSAWTYRGVLLGVSLLGAFTVLGAARLTPATPVARLLRWWPLHRLGRWSYGIYLFHWPVAVALRGEPMLGIQRFVLVSGISIGLAAASYELLEHPIRRRGVPTRWRVPALVGSAAILLAACGNVAPELGRQLDDATRAGLLTPLAAPIDAMDGTRASAATGATGIGDRSSSTTTPLADRHSRVGEAVDTTTTVPPATTEIQPSIAVATASVAGTPVTATPETAPVLPAGGARVLVLGDSVPFQLAETWTRAALERTITVAVRAAPGCTPSTNPSDYYRDDTRDVCSFAQESLAGDLVNFDPAALVVYYGLAGPVVTSEGEELDSCSDAGQGALRAQLDRIIGLAIASDTMVYLVVPANPPILDWLDTDAQAGGAACYRTVYEATAAAHRVGVRLIRLDQFLCPTGPTACPTTIDGVELRYDGIHFSEPGAAVVLPWILDRLFHP